MCFFAKILKKQFEFLYFPSMFHCAIFFSLDACWLNKHSLVFTRPFQDLTCIHWFELPLYSFSLQYPHKTSHQIKQNATVTSHGIFLEWRDTTQILRIFDNLFFLKPKLGFSSNFTNFFLILGGKQVFISLKINLALQKRFRSI